MKFGLHVPNFGEFGDPGRLVDLAATAEEAGWDGFFLRDHLLWSIDPVVPLADIWIVLAAAAARTERISLGPVVTPLARRRPWNVARQLVSLDRLSQGRAVFAAGLGYPPKDEFEVFGEESEARTRAGKLDEGLVLLAALLEGKAVDHAGANYTVSGVTFLPTPDQDRHVPIWIAGTWPNKAPFRRAARWHGVVPERADGELLGPDDLRVILAYVGEQRGSLEDFDVVVGGYSPGDDAARAAFVVAAFADAGATWWMERLAPWRGSASDLTRRVDQGPPVL